MHKDMFSSSRCFSQMLDGFRADYASRADPKDGPTFTRFAREGVKVDYVQPIYPALSMPSWTTIVTGDISCRGMCVPNVTC